MSKPYYPRSFKGAYNCKRHQDRGNHPNPNRRGRTNNDAPENGCYEQYIDTKTRNDKVKEKQQYCERLAVGGLCFGIVNLVNQPEQSEET